MSLDFVTTKLTSLAARLRKERPARLAGHRPVASVSFDDFPKGAWTLGGPVLASHGARATYYTAGGFCGRSVEGITFYDAEDLAALAAAGHEIGCHGFGHAPTPSLSDEALAEDAARNSAFLRPFLKGELPISYAYPFGRVSPRTKRLMAPRFSSIRGTHAGLNVGRVDLAQLNTISLEVRLWDEGRIEAAIARALHNHGWIIFHTHDVSETPGPYDSSPAMLDFALRKVAEARIPVLPVREALPLALGA